MKIYTKTGDDGKTGLFGGTRVSKSSHQVSAYGEVDELNGFLGMLHAHLGDAEARSIVHDVQQDLFSAGAELAIAAGRDAAASLRIELIGDAQVSRIETAIDTLEEHLTPLQNFILPGGTVGAATAHAARTVCRRAERAVIRMSESVDVRWVLVRYLNRLSDLLFVMARYLNHLDGQAEEVWNPRRASADAAATPSTSSA